jgi:hypothetical protein
MKKIFLFAMVLSFASTIGTSQIQDTLKIHFLYGSKPFKKYNQTEQKWFGGILGGHADVEANNSGILNILPNKNLHYIAQPNNIHSKFEIQNYNKFYSILGKDYASVKKAIVYIPITIMQKKMFDSIANAYTKQSPYDYAFVGMRCGASTYEILAQLGVLKKLSHRKTFLKIAYVRKLRKRIFKLAKNNNYKIKFENGVSTRKWESD